MSCDVGETMEGLENEAQNDDFVIGNDCGPQDYMKDVNWPSNSKD